MRPVTVGSTYQLAIFWFALSSISCAARGPVAVGLRCPNGHLYESIGEHHAKALRGVIMVRYPAGDTHPMPDALIQVVARGNGKAVHSAQTGDDGSFHFSEVPPGTYAILVCKEGFAALEGRVVVSRDASAEEIRLETSLDW